MDKDHAACVATGRRLLPQVVRADLLRVDRADRRACSKEVRGWMDLCRQRRARFVNADFQKEFKSLQAESKYG